MKTKTNILNKIHKKDNVEFMNSMPEGCVDLIFADPPYNMQLDKDLIRFNGEKFSGVNDMWDKYSSFKEYDDEAKKWLISCFRVLKDDGSLWVIGSYHNIHRLGYILQNLGAWIISEIVWEKTNPVPNFAGTRFVNAQETMLWVTKNKNVKFTFNYKTMKKINGGKQMKSVWRIPICNGNERLRDEKGKKIHSTQKPLKLLEWIILASSKYGDVVLDPFSGTGTTAHAAKKLGRSYIGIEKSAIYVNASKKRLKMVKETSLKEFKCSIPDIKPPRIKYKDLFDCNLLKTNYSYEVKDKNIKLKFSNLGMIYYKKEWCSPNKVVRMVFNKPTNSWNTILVNGKLINDIREEYIKGLKNGKK